VTVPSAFALTVPDPPPLALHVTVCPGDGVKFCALRIVMLAVNALATERNPVATDTREIPYVVDVSAIAEPPVIERSSECQSM
jgi:hypothetical protein